MNIKFRGKRIDSDEWIYGFYSKEEIPADIEPNTDNWDVISFIEDGHMFSYFVVPESVGLWTGLKDKNKKEAYKGDIYKDDIGRTYLIDFIKGGFGSSLIQGDGLFSLPAPLADLGTMQHFKLRCEVIGNIHENPNLLKE